MLTKGIRTIMTAILRDQVTALSWGISNISISKSSISFHVSGFRYCGQVSICVQSEHSCIIKLNNIDVICAPSEAVEILDKKIERTDNYIEKITNIIKA